jgi:hypothetical protein
MTEERVEPPPAETRVSLRQARLRGARLATTSGSLPAKDRSRPARTLRNVCTQRPTAVDPNSESAGASAPRSSPIPSRRLPRIIRRAPRTFIPGPSQTCVKPKVKLSASAHSPCPPKTAKLNGRVLSGCSSRPGFYSGPGVAKAGVSRAQFTIIINRATTTLPRTAPPLGTKSNT